MSGGHFDYAFCRISDLATELDYEIKINDQKIDDAAGIYPQNLTPDALYRMKATLSLLQMAADLAHAAEWIYSGDDGDDAFIRKYEEITNKYDWIHVGENEN